MSSSIETLECEINNLKREKERIDQDFNQRRQQLLNRFRGVMTPGTSINLATEMMDLNNEYRWKSARINNQIQDAQFALLNELRIK